MITWEPEHGILLAGKCIAMEFIRFITMIDAE
jgi:hypothetical protein